MLKAFKIPALQGKKAMTQGKKVLDIKHHIIFDRQGLPHAIMITTANVTDRDGALQIGKSVPCGMPCQHYNRNIKNASNI